jgi:hypothetical protein
MYTEREIIQKFKRAQEVFGVVAVVGARQAGKTTFLKERMKEVDASYVLFDDPDVRELFEEDIKKFESQYVAGHEVAVLDEVQYCPNAGRNLKYLVDRGRRLWITSSSEIILAKEILSYLVGRVSIIRLYPFSLREFLAAKGQKTLTSRILERSVWEHMTYGGYPKVVTTEGAESKKMILENLRETMILKDIAQTFSIEDISTLEAFVKYLSTCIGKVLSYEETSSEMRIAFQTVKKYLDAMERSYLLARITPFYTNKKKELTKRPKIYFIDTGLRNAVARDFPLRPTGDLFENYVFTELLKLGFAPRFWRTKAGAEVDFVIGEGEKVVPIEVKISASFGKIGRGLRSFIKTYGPRAALVVSYHGKKGKMNFSGCEVVFTDVLEMRELLTTKLLQ